MTTPNSFEMGRAIGSNISNAIVGSQEKNAIDEILAQVNSSEDPEAVNNAIGQILRQVRPERQEAALHILQNKQQQIAQAKKAQAYQEQGLNHFLPESINKEIVKKRGEVSDQQKSYQKSMNLINRAYEILDTGHVGSMIAFLGTGRKSKSTRSPEGIRLRSEYKQIGKALVQAAAPLKITNRTEFEHFAKNLEDTNRPIEEIKGSLDALVRIVKSNMGENQAFVGQEIQPNVQTQQQSAAPDTKKPPLESFYR